MAAINTLTDREIRSALKRAASEGREIRVPDGGGLRFDAQPSGAGWWRLRYRFGGAERMLSLGTYPVVTLADARSRRDEARRRVAAGADPSDERKAAKQERARAVEVAGRIASGKGAPGTFEAVAREWLAVVHEASVSPSHAERTRIRLERDAFPFIGAVPVADIEPRQVLDALRLVEARGAFETAHRLNQACNQVFRYGIAAGHCKRNPAADVQGALRPVPTRHHAAIVDPKRGGELLRDMVAYRGSPVTRAALALSAMLLLRPGELRQLEWAWVDLDGAVITVPGALMKRKKAEKVNGPPHLVPLARQAVAILRDLQSMAEGSKFVFPALTTRARPMSENTVNLAIRRMGYDRDTMTAHGFRAMARTMLAERLNVQPEVIEAQLAHAVTDPLGRAYNRTQFIEQRVLMMQKWADYLDRLRDVALVPVRAA